MEGGGEGEAAGRRQGGCKARLFGSRLLVQAQASSPPPTAYPPTHLQPRTCSSPHTWPTARARSPAPAAPRPHAATPAAGACGSWGGQGAGAAAHVGGRAGGQAGRASVALHKHRCTPPQNRPYPMQAQHGKQAAHMNAFSASRQPRSAARQARSSSRHVLLSAVSVAVSSACAVSISSPAIASHSWPCCWRVRCCCYGSRAAAGCLGWAAGGGGGGSGSGVQIQ